MQTIETSEKFWDALSLFLSKYNIYVSGFVGFTLCVNIIALIVLFVKLGYYGENPQKRAEVVRELLVCFLCFALLGGVTSIYVYAIIFIF